MQVVNEIQTLVANLSIGQYKRQCPECQDSRSKHKKDKPLSINVDSKGVRYRCHHCGTEGGWVHDSDDFDFELPVRPSPVVVDGTTNTAAFEYLRSRNIAEEVIQNYAILGTRRFNGKVVPSIGFPYRDPATGDVVNAVKWRSADGSKSFSQENVCEDFYNLDEYVEGNDILICEGEIDAQSWMSCNLPDNLTVLSIPNGAPHVVKDGKIDPADDNKFRYIWRAERQLSSAPRIILN